MIRDLGLFVVGLFIVGLAIVVIYVAYDGISDALYNQSFMTNDTNTIIQEGADEFPETWDYVFLTVFIGVFLGIMAISYVLRTYPILFILFVLVIVVVAGLAGYLSNAFADIAADAPFTAALSNFPIMTFIFTNYLLFIVVMVMCMLLVFFAKPNEGYP